MYKTEKQDLCDNLTMVTERSARIRYKSPRSETTFFVCLRKESLFDGGSRFLETEKSVNVRFSPTGWFEADDGGHPNKK